MRPSLLFTLIVLTVFTLVVSSFFVGFIIYGAGTNSLESLVDQLMQSDSRQISTQIIASLRQLQYALGVLARAYDERGLTLWQNVGNLDLDLARTMFTVLKALPSVTTIGLAKPDLGLDTGALNLDVLTLQIFNATHPVTYTMDQFGNPTGYSDVAVYDYVDSAHNGANAAPWWAWARDLPLAQRGTPNWGMPFFVGWKDPTHATEKIQVQLSIVYSHPQTGNLLGVMWTACRLDVFSQFLRRDTFTDPSERAIVLESNGDVVAGTHAETLGGLTDPKVVNLFRTNVFKNTAADTISEDAARYLQQKYGSIAQWPFTTTVKFTASNGEDFFVHCSPIKDEMGLDWIVVHSKPVRLALKDIKAARTSGILIGLGIIIAASIALAICLILFARPLGKLADRLRAVSRMEVDEPGENHYVFSELHRLHESFTELTHKLQEYKKHMPDALLTNLAQSGNPAQPVSEEEDNNPNVRTPLSSDHAEAFSTSNTSGQNSARAPGRHSTSASHSSRSIKIDDGLKVRKIVMLVVRLTDNVTVQATSEWQLLTKQFLNIVVQEIKDNKGVIHSVQARQIVAHFSAISFVSSASEKALTAAFRIQTQLEKLNQQHSALALPELRVGMGVARGDAIVGDMGSDRVRFFGVIGSVTKTLEALAFVSNAMGGVVLVDQSVESQHSGVISFRHVDTVRYVATQAPQRIFQPLRLRGNQANNEWMYELDAQQHPDPQQQTDFAAALKAYQSGSTDPTKWNAYLSSYSAPDVVASYYAAQVTSPVPRPAGDPGFRELTLLLRAP
eukprot:TRINITY_DN11799_c0_g1_i1.p1 TRINITY_DN11799_c0_g1~~TRINITY_DN11799_c0_g1_i1.p1  ORF type:complete len:788 (-),score=106.09 TRINITY_DN11799_c0_g1_i1:69-2432(-)